MLKKTAVAIVVAEKIVHFVVSTTVGTKVTKVANEKGLGYAAEAAPAQILSANAGPSASVLTLKGGSPRNIVTNLTMSDHVLPLHVPVVVVAPVFVVLLL